MATTDVMTMGEVIKVLNELTNGDAIITTDVGQHQMVACRYANFNNSKSSVTSGGLGTMGFGLPAAIGAWYGAPEKTVVAIIGDGGFQMTLQELGTIMQFLPAVAALWSIVWTTIRIWETKTVQDFIAKFKTSNDVETISAHKDDIQETIHGDPNA